MAALCAVVFATAPAFATDRVDCGGVAKWSSDKNYKKGDKVWHPAGGNVYYEYQCDQDQCHGAGDNEPGSKPSIWKNLGWCKETPS